MSRLPCTHEILNINTPVTDVCDEYIRFILQQGVSGLKADTHEDIAKT